MANEYAVNQADLEAVADAIREKGGTTDALTFPGGFVDAVGAIEAGGGGVSLNVDSKGVLDGVVPFKVVSDEISDIKLLAYSNVTEIDCPNVWRVLSARNNKLLTRVNLPKMTTLGQSGFAECTALTQIVLPKVKLDQQRAFSDCSALEYVRMDETLSVGGWQWAFSNCKKLKTVIAPKAEETVGAATFIWCPRLETVVLGNVNSEKICPLNNVSAFEGTPLRGIDGVYSGHVYVPQALIAEYQAATNWSMLYAAYPEIFQPIEGSEYE